MRHTGPRFAIRFAGYVTTIGLLLWLLAIPAVQAGQPPAITAFSPACGPVGTSVAIGGNHLQGVTRVDFNGVIAAFTVNSGNLITTTVPTGATTGKIRVTSPDGSGTSRDDFTVSSSCAPTITSFSPTSGPVGTTVTINGSNFVGATAVKFNVTSATTFSWNPSGTQLTATVPTGATTGKIGVTTPFDTATSSSDFTVTVPAKPTITSFSPTSGPVGTVVTITGTNFTGATSVKFGGVAATNFHVDSATQITATVPTGAVTGRISVTTPAGTGQSSSDFVVTVPPAPTITAFSPTSGPVGTVVTITGTNFTGATSVKFGGVAATNFTVNPSGTQITATVPTGAVTGRISVTTSGGTATSATNFTVTTAPAPTITSFVPISGPVGTSVVITGTNLTGATDVKFKNTSATSFHVDSGTQITAVVPSGAMTGRISVTTPGGTATSSTNFTVTSAGSPTITSFSPTSGPVGTSVTIVGTNFTGITSVRFGGVAATNFTVNSSTQIRATVPAGAKTGPITVTNAHGTGTSATNFTVTGGPTITSFSPTSGTVGTSVTILGTGFTGTTRVLFNTTVAITFAVNTAGTQITTTVPVGATTGRISVVAPSGTAVSTTNFTVLTFHRRSISLALRRHLVARGIVRVSDGFAACYRHVPVRIQRRVAGIWRTIASTSTDSTGFYRVRIADRAGRYRSVAPKVVMTNDVCRRAVSPVVIHT